MLDVGGQKWCITKNTVLKQLVSVKWMADSNEIYLNHRRYTCTVCSSMGSVMFRLIRLYDTIVNDTLFRPSTRVSLDVATCDYICIFVSTPLAQSTTAVSVYVIRITAFVITGLGVAIVQVCICLD